MNVGARIHRAAVQGAVVSCSCLPVSVEVVGHDVDEVQVAVNFQSLEFYISTRKSNSMPAFSFFFLVLISILCSEIKPTVKSCQLHRLCRWWESNQQRWPTAAAESSLCLWHRPRRLWPAPVVRKNPTPQTLYT